MRKPLPFGMWLATCFVIGCLLGGYWYLYHRLQVARVDSIERLCLRANAQQQDNIDFVIEDVGNRRLGPKARARFKMESDCHRYALRTANLPPPQPGTPKP